MVKTTGIALDSGVLDESPRIHLVGRQCGLRGFMNRPLQIRMMGSVGGERETPSSTRLGCDRLSHQVKCVGSVG